MEPSAVPVPCVLVEFEKRPQGGKPGLGFSIGGGIDQDSTKNPFFPNDNGIFVTNVQPDSTAAQAGLKIGDKILEVNGFDLTMATHKHAVKLLTKERDLSVVMKITRADLITQQQGHY